MATKIYLCLNQDDIVTDIMVTDYAMIHPERYEWPVADYTLTGKQFDRATETFSDVAQPAPVYSKLEFRQRFTLEEWATLYSARATDVVLQIFLDDLIVTEEVNTAHPQTQMGMGYLYQNGYITYERMLEILG